MEKKGTPPITAAIALMMSNPKAEIPQMLDPVYVYPSGQEMRRKRRASEKKKKKK